MCINHGQKLNKVRDFANGRYGMRKLGFFQQKFKLLCEDAKVRIFYTFIKVLSPKAMVSMLRALSRRGFELDSSALKEYDVLTNWLSSWLSCSVFRQSFLNLSSFSRPASLKSRRKRCSQELTLCNHPLWSGHSWCKTCQACCKAGPTPPAFRLASWILMHFPRNISALFYSTQNTTHTCLLALKIIY
jgi:hypothetical protein